MSRIDTFKNSRSNDKYIYIYKKKEIYLVFVTWIENRKIKIWKKYARIYVCLLSVINKKKNILER